jgi:hypothetical protein
MMLKVTAGTVVRAGLGGEESREIDVDSGKSSQPESPANDN